VHASEEVVRFGGVPPLGPYTRIFFALQIQYYIYVYINIYKYIYIYIYIYMYIIEVKGKRYLVLSSGDTTHQAAYIRSLLEIILFLWFEHIPLAHFWHDFLGVVLVCGIFFQKTPKTFKKNIKT
jgi:hypothetical protein